MHEEHIVCKVRQHKYNSYKGQIGKVAPNLLQRDFSTTKSNEKWVTDVTQFKLFGTKLYLSPILDLHDQSLISWNLSESPNYAQTVDMLEKAFAQIPDGTNLILHSDQGWQYQMYDYQRRLKEKGIRQSMSRKGNCLDNSVMENADTKTDAEKNLKQKQKKLQNQITIRNQKLKQIQLNISMNTFRFS